MDLKYILIITVSSLFMLLFFIYIFVMTRTRAKDSATMEKIEKMYGDKNLAKMDYDCAVYDEETERLIAARTAEHDQLTIEDVITHDVAAAIDEKVFKTVEVEGVEEITGNYKPEDN